MTLDLISDGDCIITGNKRYMRMSVRQEIIEIHTEIMNSKTLTAQFYSEFDKSIDQLINLFDHFKDMTAGERMMRTATFPPIPKFVHGVNPLYLKVGMTQFDEINAITKLLHSDAANIAQILYYISIPPILYAEFPYLVDHFRIVEFVINIYLEKTDSAKRLQIYDIIRNYVPNS